MDVPADLDLHWSYMRKNAYIWRKGLILFQFSHESLAIVVVVLLIFNLHLSQMNRRVELAIYSDSSLCICLALLKK
jgi:hypothetical protein